MCDEGRYGFGRFLPADRVKAAYSNKGNDRIPVSIGDAVAALKGQVKTLTVLCSPDLLLEEYYMLRQLMLRASSVSRAVVAYRGRALSPVEEILVSPDYASNFRAAQLVGLIGELPDVEYNEIIAKIRRKEIENILLLGDRAIDSRDLDEALLAGLQAAKLSVGILTAADSQLANRLSFVIPGRSILEKCGLLLNRRLRLQYAQNVVPLRDDTVPDWRFLGQLADAAGVKLLTGDLAAMSDREVTRWYLATDPLLASQGLTIQAIKDGGVQLQAGVGPAGSPRSAEVSQGASPAV